MKTKDYGDSGEHSVRFCVAPTSPMDGTGTGRNVAIWLKSEPRKTAHMQPAEAIAFAGRILKAARKAQKNG